MSVDAILYVYMPFLFAFGFLLDFANTIYRVLGREKILYRLFELKPSDSQYKELFSEIGNLGFRYLPILLGGVAIISQRYIDIDRLISTSIALWLDLWFVYLNWHKIGANLYGLGGGMQLFGVRPEWGEDAGIVRPG